MLTGEYGYHTNTFDPKWVILYRLVLKNLYLFANCHSTLFRWVIYILFEIDECYALYFYLNLWITYIVKY